MNIADDTKEKVKREIVAVLSGFSEVRRVVIFGSFVTSDNPHDLDIAVFQDSDEGYYPLARKYRRTLRNIARMIPLDVIPVRPNPEQGSFLREIEKGEVVYAGSVCLISGGSGEDIGLNQRRHQNMVATEG